MKQKELFLLADAAILEVLRQVRDDQLDLPAPQDWTRTPDPDIRAIVAAHARDEAWVPDVLAGRTIDEVGDRWTGDLLGESPVAAYEAIHATTTAAIEQLSESDADRVVHLTYGDFPVAGFLEHISYYRAFQARQIADHLHIPFAMDDRLIELLSSTLETEAEALREWGVFPPAQQAPEGATREQQLLALVGFLD